MEVKVSTTESGGRKHHRAEAQEVEKLMPSDQRLQDGVEGPEQQKSREWGIRGFPQDRQWLQGFSNSDDLFLTSS